MGYTFGATSQKRWPNQGQPLKLFSQSFILHILGPWPGINLFLQEIRCFHSADSICPSTLTEKTTLVSSCFNSALPCWPNTAATSFCFPLRPRDLNITISLAWEDWVFCQSRNGCIPQDQRIRSSQFRNNVHFSDRESLSKSHSTQTVTFLDWKPCNDLRNYFILAEVCFQSCKFCR